MTKTQRVLIAAIAVLGCGAGANDSSGVDASSLQPEVLSSASLTPFEVPVLDRS